MPGILDSVNRVPPWARRWCYFYLLSAALLALTSFLTLIMAIFTFSNLKKGQGTMLVAYCFALIFQAISAMVMFWMCRSSLKNA
jgi:hypothetical protein